MRGYFAIGIENCKTKANLGTLWRSAHIFGAAYIFVIGRRYEKQASDTTKAWRSVPLFQYDTFDDFYRTIPRDCILTGVEITPRARSLITTHHSERAIYLLGAEDHGLSKMALEKCHRFIQIPGTMCLNVAVAGSVVMYDRLAKAWTKETTLPGPRLHERLGLLRPVRMTDPH